MIYSHIRKVLMLSRVPLDIGNNFPTLSFYYLVEQIVIRAYNVPRGISKSELSKNSTWPVVVNRYCS